MWLLVEGSSMSPFLRPGDEIYFVPLLNTEVQPGDLLVLRSSPAHNEVPTLMVHRAIRSNEVLQTKGDRSPFIDQEAILLGKVLGRRRGGQEWMWGEIGQPLKKQVALLSRISAYGPPGHSPKIGRVLRRKVAVAGLLALYFTMELSGRIISRARIT